MFPKCCICGEELRDWQGNVMVPQDALRGQPVSEVVVICKPCTTRLDERGAGQKWHNLWELVWIRDHPIYYLGWVIASLVDENARWKLTAEAADTIYSLAAMAHPDLARGVIGQFLFDTEKPRVQEDEEGE